MGIVGQGQQIGLKGTGAAHHGACPVHGDAVTVKNQVVVGPHLVGVDHGHGEAGGAVTQHGFTGGLLLHGEGGGGQVHHQIHPQLSQGGDGVGGISALAPKLLVVPEVFADGDADVDRVALVIG